MTAPVPIKLATFNADFSAAKQFKAVLEPAPVLGAAFDIAIYAPETYLISSLYGTVSAAVIKDSEIKTELLAVNAEPSFPVKRLISKRAKNPIVDTDAREIVCANNAAEIEAIEDLPNLTGTVEWVYETYGAQVFTHSALNWIGDYVLFSYNGSGCYHAIPFNIGDNSGSAAIKIGAYPLRAGSVGYDGIYANFIVHPISSNILIKTDVGTATKYADVSHLIWREQISFSGKEASAAFYIDSKKYFSGFFFDGFGNEINPTFSVSNGKLIASVECWGSGYLTYFTGGTIYDYYADVVYPLGGGVTVTIGSAFAFDKKKKGIAASYEIPILETGKANREDLIIVYREVIVQGANSFEMPDGTSPAWPEGNSYIHYPSALVDDKPVIGDAYAVAEEQRHIVFVNNGALHDDVQAPYWYKPETVNAFNGVKWKIKDRIPSSPTDTISADLISVLTARKAELVTLYGIV